ncbi:hypothetical protein [Bradyrhizobium sp. sGM-13]|uniref:hypothetical protein n=1 Tax=Bradyrhizobium sp. sGM-13 TaxID=2831781 RepID=UPI001BCF489A|nr:hypothetical protein [Bradyrhizobium sp. sGM-13]
MGLQLIVTLREALQHSLDELNRINAAHNCVRPDVTCTLMKALALLPPIPNASEVERAIVGRLVTDLLAAGYRITVNDGEEDVVKTSNDPNTIFKALASTDSDTLEVFNPAAEKRHSFVVLVWGNETDVISDYGVSLEPVIAAANALANELEAA